MSPQEAASDPESESENLSPQQPPEEDNDILVADKAFIDSEVNLLNKAEEEFRLRMWELTPIEKTALKQRHLRLNELNLWCVYNVIYFICIGF